MFTASQKTKIVGFINKKIDLPIIGETMEAAIISPLVDLVASDLSKYLPRNFIAALNDTNLSASFDSTSLLKSLNESVLQNLVSKIGNTNTNTLLTEIINLIGEAAQKGKSLDSILK